MDVAKVMGVRPAAYHKVWDDRKTGSKPHHVSFWRPVPPRGFYRVADLAQRTHEKEPAQVARCLVVAAHGSVSDGSPPVLRPPVDYTCVWTDRRSGGRYGNCSLWVPVAPEGYCALGCVAVVGYEKPGLDEVMCVHSSLCTPAGVVSEDPTGPLWKDAGSGSVNDVSIWTMAPLEIGEGISIDSFLAVPHHGTKVNPAQPFAFCGLYSISTNAIIIESPQSPLVATIAASASAAATASTTASTAASISASMCGFGGFASALASLAAPATAPLLPFGVDPATLPLERDDATGLTVPRGLVALRRLFYALNGHMEEGIFRLAGSETECQKMQASLNKPRNVDKQGNFSFDVFPNDVHAVSSLIKRWYRELPVRLLAGSAACVADLSGRLAAARDDRAVLLGEIRDFPDSLSPLQKDLFLFLMGLGRDVARNSAVNKMVPRNIAVVFAPMLVERTSPMEEMMRTSEVMPFLVACLELPDP